MKQPADMGLQISMAANQSSQAGMSNTFSRRQRHETWGDVIFVVNSSKCQCQQNSRPCYTLEYEKHSKDDLNNKLGRSVSVSMNFAVKRVWLSTLCLASFLCGASASRIGQPHPPPMDPLYDPSDWTLCENGRFERNEVTDRELFPSKPLLAFPECNNQYPSTQPWDERAENNGISTCLVMYCKNDTACAQFTLWSQRRRRGNVVAADPGFVFLEGVAGTQTGLSCSILSHDNVAEYIGEHCEQGFAPREQDHHWEFPVYRECLETRRRRYMVVQLTRGEKQSGYV